ncbi:Pogo transposable element with KRAB domain [Fragilaria crotonensis]|nr:Pogo transposable element with KRAB domain [Fragilaria crotonensis]
MSSSSSEDDSSSNNDDGVPSNVPPASSVKTRRRFSIQQKMGIIRTVSRLMEQEGMTRCEACRSVNIHPTMHLLWTKQADTMMELKKRNIRAKSTHSGRMHCLAEHTEDLLAFIFELREKGMGVTIPMVAVKAAQISRDFNDKTRMAQYHSARRFVRAQGLVVFRLGTNESQRSSPQEVVADALDFIVNVVRPKVSEPTRHQDYILNMDQTPVPFTFNKRKALDIVGRRTVYVRRSTGDTKRATFAMTVTASGKVLKPVIIFKGARNGRIVTREFPNYEEDMVYLCQGAAWMDEEAMLVWVDRMLQPYIETAPPGVMPILFLDAYRCHMMASVVTRIQNLGVEVQHIPGGCTSLCQPVDIGVSKPFKNRPRSEWENWMILEGLEHGTTSPPTRADIIRWCRFAMNDLPEEMVRNAWRHAEYSWFPLPPAPDNDHVVNQFDDDDDDDDDNDNVSDSEENSDNESSTSSHMHVVVVRQR